MILILPNHFFRPSLISVSNILQFQGRDVTFLSIFLLGFDIFSCYSKWFDFQKFFLQLLIDSIQKCMLSIDLVAQDFMKFTYDSSLFEDYFGFFTYTIMWSANKYSFTSSFFISMPITSFIFFFIEVQLIYNVVLVSGVQQRDSDIDIDIDIDRYRYRYRYRYVIGYYKVLNIVPCAIQYNLIVYLFYIRQCVSLNTKLLIYAPSFSLW